MRVTKVIREYVEEKVKAKFQPAIDSVFKEYDARFDMLRAELEEIVNESEVRAIAACEKYNIDPVRPSGGKIIQYNTYGIHNHSEYAELNKKAAGLRAKRDEAIKDILLALEIGETSKDDLKAAIDAVEI